MRSFRGIIILTLAFAFTLPACVHHEPRIADINALFERSAADAKQANPFMVVGHRGAAGVAPENTMAAFEVAARLGVPFELDTMLCKSGEPVVIHDYTVDRTTNGSGRVAELTLAELKQLDAGSHFDARYKNERIPTLAEVLDRYASTVMIDIEIKYEGPSAEAHRVADAVVELVREKGLIDRVFVSAFNPYVLEAFKKAEPQILRGQLYSHFKKADIPYYQKVVLRNLMLNGAADPDFLAPDHELVDRDYVETYHDLGYRIVPYTVNDEARLRELRDFGVDAIITDFPERALNL